MEKVLYHSDWLKHGKQGHRVKSGNTFWGIVTAPQQWSARKGAKSIRHRIGAESEGGACCNRLHGYSVEAGIHEEEEEEEVYCFSTQLGQYNKNTVQKQ